MKESTQLSDKQYWEKEWNTDNPYDYKKFIFGSIIRRFIPQGHTFIEIGCAPGTIMAFFNKCMNYEVTGIDYVNTEIVENYLKQNQVTDYFLINQDFTTLKLERKYDVVASFGFIEHFSDPKKIIVQHQKLVDENGYLILELPNFRFFNWFVIKLLRPHLLSMHNLAIMNLKLLHDYVVETGEFEIAYCDYYKSCFLFFNLNNFEVGNNDSFLKYFLSSLSKTLTKLRLDNLPNRFFSPYIILIAKRIS